MQLTLAEKISIVLSATTLTFVFGLAACSPLAPSVEKNRLRINSGHQGGGSTGAPEERPEPTPNGTHLLLTRSGANVYLGKDAAEWYLKKHSTHSSKEFLSSPAANPDTLEQFKQIGRVDIPTTPSSDWLENAPSGKVVFHLNLTSSTLTPAQLDSFLYDLEPPTAAEIRLAIEGGTSVDWTLRIRPSVERETRQAFLSALEQFRLVVATAERQ